MLSGKNDFDKDRALWNKDIAPIPIRNRSWNMWYIAAFWTSMTITIPTYMIGASIISNGFNWWQTTLIVAIGNFIVWIPLILIGYIGTKYGIPFPVLLRLSFGTKGAKIAALLRAAVACGWFGIFTWIETYTLYIMLILFYPSLQKSYYLGSFIDLNLLQAVCFLLCSITQAYIISCGINFIKILETIAAPLMLILGITLMIWMIIKVGSFQMIIVSSYKLQRNGDFHFSMLWPCLGAVIANWIAVAINIPDFTRYAKTQKAQIIGQFIGLIPSTVLFAFIGIIVTSATILIYGHAIWDPIDLLNKLDNKILIVLTGSTIILATLTTNIGANVIAAANDFSNLFPSKISFKLGGYIVVFIGLTIFPWRFISSLNGFIFNWLLAYTVVLSALGGIMICDYYVIRKTKIDLYDLYDLNGQYSYKNGWNWTAFIVLILAIIPSVPGFLVNTNLISYNFPVWMITLYNYNWLVSFFMAMFLYWYMIPLAYKKNLKLNIGEYT